MKKMTKVLSVTGGICAGVGVIFLGAGIALGGTADLADSISVRAADFRKVTEWLGSDEDEYWYDDINNLDPKQWQCVMAAGIKDLEIDMSAGYLEISPYDGKGIKVYTRHNDNRTEIDWEGEELDISSDLSSGFWKKGKAVKILVPKSQIFDSVTVYMSAGEAVIDSFKTEEIYVSADAASVTISGEVQAKTSEWSASAGSIEVNRLQSRDTDLDCSAGEIQMQMSGSKEDYLLYADISAGNLEYGGQEWSSLDQSFELGPDDAENNIDAECSAGNIIINFVK